MLQSQTNYRTRLTSPVASVAQQPKQGGARAKRCPYFPYIVEAVHFHETRLSSPVARPETPAPPPQPDRLPPSTLTRRQMQVLLLFKEGDSISAVSLKLGVKDSTVIRHCHRIFEKLGVPCMHRAVAEGIRRGWIV